MKREPFLFVVKRLILGAIILGIIVSIWHPLHSNSPYIHSNSSDALYAQYPCTTSTNVGFQVPNIGNTTNWGSCINTDLNLLDVLLGGVSNLATATTTPTVAGNANWLTNNTSAVTIANFLGGFPGQSIRIICGPGDVYTQVSNSSNIKVVSTFSCSTSTAIQFTLSGTTWYETGRGGGGGTGSSIFQQWQFGTTTAITGNGNYIQLTASPAAVLSLTQSGSGTSGSPYIDTLSVNVQGTDNKLLSSGTISGSTGALLCLDSSGGATTTCSTGSVTSVAFTVNAASSSGIFAVSGSPVTTTGTLNVNLTGTSGGIPYFSTTAVLSSSAVLPAGNFVLGGGVGGAPTATFAVVPVANGGCAATTPAGCIANIMPTPTRPGDVPYWNGTAWVTLAGNNSGTQAFTENSSGVPSFASVLTNSMTTLGDLIMGGASGAPTRLAGPTAVNGAPYVLIDIPASGAATAENWSLMGVSVDPQTGNYTLSCPVDRNGEIEFNISAAATLTLPQPGSSSCLQTNPALVVRNASTSTAILTISTGSTYFQPENTSSQMLIPGSAFFIYSDATSSTGNYHAVPIASAPGGVNTQTGNYTATLLDKDHLVVMNCSSACVLTLPATPPSTKWYIRAVSIGSTLATVSLNGLNYDGSATAPLLITKSELSVFTDGTNYFGGIPSAGGGGSTFPVTVSGTVTSGGIPCFTSTTQESSSSALTVNVLVKGGGAGVCPSNSSVTDNGTTVTSSDTGGYVAPVFVANGSTSGFIDFPQGSTSSSTAPCNTATSICVQAPTSVTSYLITLSGTGPANNNMMKTYSALSSSNTNESFVQAPVKTMLTSPYTNATTGATTIFTIAVDASTSYTIHCEGLWKAAASGYWGFGMTGPAAPALVTYSFVKTNTISSAAPTPLEYDGTGASYPTGIGETAVGTAVTDMRFVVDVGFTNGTTAGNLTITGLTVTGDTLTVESGSWCVAQ